MPHTAVKVLNFANKVSLVGSSGRKTNSEIPDFYILYCKELLPRKKMV